MDNLCHTLVGAALGEAGLKRRTRFANATLMIASNLPDVDVLVFATSTPAVAFRRGWTHGLIAQALLPILLTAVMVVIARTFPSVRDSMPARAGWLLLLSYVGVFLHVLLDLLNSYGLRILAPFSWQWFYGDALFIIDPWLWITLGVGVWMSRRRIAVAPARRALFLAAIYIVVMVVAARAARDFVIAEWARERGENPRAVMVGPLPVTPLTREVIVDAGTHYERGTFRWLPRRVTFQPAAIPKNNSDPRIARARESPNVRGFLVWSRFPFWTLSPADSGTLVTVRDMRFTGQTPARFEASTVVGDAE
jgi:inner membrane protein